MNQREIKFRAWDKKNKRFFDPIKWAKELRIHLQMGISVDSGLAEKENVDVFQIELQQFTGLKDKNGKEIYEGDIVQRYHSYPLDGRYKGRQYRSGKPVVVKWVNDCKKSGFNMGEGDGTGSKEVIGNIYENPELLKL